MLDVLQMVRYTTVEPIELKWYNSWIPVGVTSGCYYLIIVDDPFKTAGRYFNWDTYDITRPAGLGADKQMLYDCRTDAKLVRVGVSKDGKIMNDRCYQTSPQTWIRFSEETHSIQQKPQTEIYVMPWNTDYFATIWEDFTEIFKHILSKQRERQ